MCAYVVFNKLVSKYSTFTSASLQFEEQKQKNLLDPWQFAAVQEQKLMGWVLLWWKFPLAMSYAMQVCVSIDG